MDEVTIDPEQIVSDVVTRSRRPPAGRAPALLRRRAAANQPLPPVQQSNQVCTIHQEWARMHDEDRAQVAEATARQAPSRSVGGVKAKVRARVATAAAEGYLPAHQQNRALIGDLIRATDTLAKRIDEVAERLAGLEALVEEVVQVVSEDLVRVLAAVGTAPGDGPPAPGGAPGSPGLPVEAPTRGAPGASARPSGGPGRADG